MSDELCRLCLTTQNLSPLFKFSDQIDEYSSVLLLITGLKIEANDGLPQNICETCTNAIDSALQLGNRSQVSEKHLLVQKYQKRKENITEYETVNKLLLINKDKNTDFIEDCEDINGFQDINNDPSDSEQNGAETKWPPRAVKKMSKKEKREMYMNLIEGPFDPNGPVKCKVCKNTVSKWSCFLSHAKLHLGFNFICEFCGKSFISSTQLNRHSRSHHGIKRNIQCNHCNYLALDNTQLKIHERRVHTGERPYVCDVCASSYHSRKCLVQHIESHRSNANVQCPDCPQHFKSNRALSRHRYSAHCSRRAACPHCNSTYSSKYINAHVMRCRAREDDFKIL